MAQGLRCPHCGHKHPVAQLAGTPTFRCAGCGQVLKTPQAYRAPAGHTGQGSPSDVPRAAPTAPSTYQRPVQRVVPGGRGDRAFEGPATEALPVVAPRPQARPRPAAAGNGAARPVAAGALPWPWRVLVWGIALPLGLLIVVFVARWLGFLTGNNLFDVISGSGLGRYVRLFVLAPFAALVIATMAHFALERLPVMLANRRASRRGGGGGGGAPYDDAYEDPRRDGRRAPQRAGRPAGRRTAS
jgi:hypothetical protein